MKKLIILLAIFTIFATTAQSVGINADGSSANASAILDLKSTTQGFLPPRMTTTERNAIGTPATGLVIFNTTTNGLEVKSSTGWTSLTTTSNTGFTPCGTTITDIDGNSYNTVLIGAQCWTKENLRVTRYNDGTAIQFDATGGSGGESTTWQNLTIGAHSILENDNSNLTKYGYLYNGYAAKGIYTTGSNASTNTLNICPSGWHVPTDAEWTTLTTELGGEDVAGGKMKSIGMAYWNSPNTGATNESGFSALPGGFRDSSGTFHFKNSSGFWWSSTEYQYLTDWVWYRISRYNQVNVMKSANGKTDGFSVRCLRD